MKPEDKQRIFIVEDNLMYQSLIEKQLESLDAELHFYTKGETCLNDLYKNPSIVILDYDLEGVFNGLDTLQQIRRHYPAIYVLLFSNQKGLHTRENVKQYGDFEYLEKRDQSFQLLKTMIHAAYIPIEG